MIASELGIFIVCVAVKQKKSYFAANRNEDLYIESNYMTQWSLYVI